MFRVKMKNSVAYLKKCRKEIAALAENSGGGGGYKFHYWLDYLWCMLRHGCLIRHYVYGGFYNQSNADRRSAMTYRRILKVYKICNQPEYIHFLENKRDFNIHFQEFVKRRWLYTGDMTFQQFSDFVDINDCAIVKPLSLCEGEGVHKIQLLKDSEGRKKQFDELKSTDALVEEFIIQNDRMKFEVKSVNTIRMHSLYTKDGDVICFKPMLRVGVGDAVIDNYCAGGCVYEVDVEDGVVIGTSLSKDHKKHKCHPGTNVMMLGYQIPNWDKVMECVTKAATKLPQCRFIGWDVAITADGIELIEGNHNPDYELMEFQGTHGWWGKLKNNIV